MTTIEPRREEAIRVGYEALSGRLNIGLDEFREKLSPWEVKAFVRGDEVVGMLMTKENELHVAVHPDVRGKWLSRRLVREVFGPILEYGEWTAPVAYGNVIGADFVKRVRKGLEEGRFDPVTAIVGGSLGSAAIGGIMGNQAANTQADAARRAQDIQSGMFGTTQQNLQPWMQGGTMALGQINQGLQPGGQFNHQFGLQDFQASPAYQFNLQEGQKAIDKSANARGNYYAPQTLQDISKFSQGLASNEFQNAFNNYQTGTNNVWNRLYNTSQSGQNAAANLGGFGTTTGGQMGNSAMAQGNAIAAGQMNLGNVAGGALNNMTNFAMMNQMMQNNQMPSMVPEMIPGQFSSMNPQYG